MLLLIGSWFLHSLFYIHTPFFLSFSKRNTYTFNIKIRKRECGYQKRCRNQFPFNILLQAGISLSYNSINDLNGSYCLGLNLALVLPVWAPYRPIFGRTLAYVGSYNSSSGITCYGYFVVIIFAFAICLKYKHEMCAVHIVYQQCRWGHKCVKLLVLCG